MENEAVSLPGKPSDMEPDVWRIHTMVGRLSDAFWRRMRQPGVSVLDEMLANDADYKLVSDEEKAIWAEVTSPRNCAALCRYVAYWKSAGITDFAARLHDKMLADALGRCDEAMGPVSANTPQPQSGSPTGGAGRGRR